MTTIVHTRVLRTQRPSSRASTRLTSLLSGAVLAAIVYSSIPGVAYPTLTASPTLPAPALTQPSVPTPTVLPGAGGKGPGASAAAQSMRFDQATVAAYLAQTWHLGGTYASQVARGLMRASERHGVDLLLLMAVAATESAFQHSVGNPDGGSDPMKPFGIMQVAGAFHAEKFPGGAVKPTSVGENLDIGARVMKEYLAVERGNERRALLRYNGSLYVSDKYARKVNRLKHQMLQGLLAQRGAPTDKRPA